MGKSFTDGPATDFQKLLDLKAIVGGARSEQSGLRRNKARSPHGPAFEPAGFETRSMDALVEVLTRTDALRVLDDALGTLIQEINKKEQS